VARLETHQTGICEGAVITRFIANIGDEANGITEVVDDYTFPLTPPDELGGDNYNGKSVIFRTRCPNGEEQVIDPIVQPPFEPTVLNNGGTYAPMAVQPRGDLLIAPIHHLIL
jgi:hypothetical protein